jgi:type IV secretory pathway protease TraF
MTAVSTAGAAAASHPRSRLRARLVLAGLSACGLAALAWASFVHAAAAPDLQPVRQRGGRLVSRRSAGPRHRLAATSVVRGQHRADPLPPEAAALAAQRGYLPTRVPLLKRVGASRRRRCASLAGIVRIDGVPSAAVLPADRWAGRCHPGSNAAAFEPGELFLLSVTNPASFDSRYFGPVSASAVIGVAHPVWLESRP